MVGEKGALERFVGGIKRVLRPNGIRGEQLLLIRERPEQETK